MRKLLDKITFKGLMIVDIVLAVMNTAVGIMICASDDVRVPFKVMYVICAVLWWVIAALGVYRYRQDKAGK